MKKTTKGAFYFVYPFKLHSKRDNSFIYLVLFVKWKNICKIERYN